MNKVLKVFNTLIRQFPKHFIILFFLIVLQTSLSVLSVLSVAPIADFFLGNSGENANIITRYFESVFGYLDLELHLMYLFIFFGGITLINGLFNLIVHYSILRVKYDVLNNMLTSSIGEFFQSRLLFFTQGDMGLLLNTFQREVAKIGDTFGGITRFFANIFHTLILLSIPIYFSPMLTGLFLILSFIISSPLIFLNRYIYSLGKKNTETANITSGILHETMTAAKLILSSGRQHAAVKRYSDSIIKHSTVSVKFQSILHAAGILYQPLGIIVVLILVYVAFIEGLQLSELSLILFSIYRLIPNMAALFKSTATIGGFAPAFEQLEKLRIDAEKFKEYSGGAEFISLNKSIRFQDVSFNYPGRKMALNQIDLNFKKNHMTALVGKSGAGKTTVVDLILGLYENTNGSLLLDGSDINQYNINSFRKKIGYVPQDPQLFDASVRENLLWSNPYATEKDMWEACKLANAKDFVSDLPGMLDTTLGDRGIRISGGQRQRLALARAIIRKPDILILDEATSALDTESERLIHDSIVYLKNKMTIIIIAHRLSTIKNANYIYVLNEGSVVQEGSFSKLADQEGHFSNMIKLQLMNN